MSAETAALLDSLKNIRSYKMVDRVPAPANQKEALMLILKGYEKSIVGKYWVKYIRL